MAAAKGAWALLLCILISLCDRAFSRESAKTRWLKSVQAILRLNRGDFFVNNLPTTAARRNHPAVLRESLVMQQQRPRLSHHASSIVELSDGHFMVTWFAGKFEGEPDVGIWISTLDPVSNNWTRPFELVKPLKEPCWNPVLFRHRATGTLMLFYKVGKAPAQWRGFLLRSTDDGKTWGQPQELPQPVAGPAKNKPLELEDGTIVAGASDEGGKQGKSWSVWVETSRDVGQTWQRIGPVTNTNSEMLQPAMFVDNYGSLRMVMRTRRGVMGTCTGDRMGQRWSPARFTDVLTPNAGIDVVRLDDGRLILVHNRSRRRGTAGRSTLDIAVSKDGGDTWTHAMNLENAPNGHDIEYSYPAVIQGSDRHVHITYTWGRYNIKYVRLDPKHIV